MFKAHFMAGALLCLGAYAQALTFPDQPNNLQGAAPLGEVYSILAGVDDSNNSQFWDTNYTQVNSISQADYASIYGAALAFPSSPYALINARYFNSSFSLMTVPDETTGAHGTFYFTGAEAAAFTPDYGGSAFVSSTITFNGYNGNTLVGSDSFNLSSTSFDWLAASFASSALTRIDIVSSGLGQRWLIDKLGLTPIVPAPLAAAAVPEPETWALLLLGAVGLCARQRRPRHLAGARP
ncbi:hypothetical protein JCM19000A_36700 [Silvimonas sp. JCM 19000]